MGVEGAPEGPEDPIAQICITVGKVRRLIQKNTRTAQILREERFSFFFFSLSLSLEIIHRRQRQKVSSCSYSSSSSLLQSKESRVIVLLLTVFLSLFIYIYTHTRTGSRLGNVRRRDEGCVQSCEMARLLQVRGVQRDEV